MHYDIAAALRCYRDAISLLMLITLLPRFVADADAMLPRSSREMPRRL